MIQLLFYSLLAGFFSLIGGLLLLWFPKVTKQLLTPLIAFGAGAFLGAAFLEMLPEALQLYPEPHPIMLFALTGFTAFYILERFLMRYFKPSVTHHHSDHTESLPFLLIVGDSFHNFLDGIVLAFSYLVDPVLGLSTALAIAAHELPQEIGDFAVLIKVGWKKSTIIAVNVIQSLLTIPGVVIGYYLGQSVGSYLPFALALASGIFMYISASDLIPEIHHRSGHKFFFRVIIPFVAAMFLIYYLSSLAHH